jgi:DNA invertase Pin-like site-specific DNA recombinase
VFDPAKVEEMERKKKKKRTREEQMAKKEAEHRGKQDAWLKFNTKHDSKRRNIGPRKVVPAINSNSQFSTPDAAKTMTGFQQRSKHVFDKTDPS